jgi:hypothetical protein
MKITIGTKPEIVIDVDSVPEEKNVEQTIVPEIKTLPMLNRSQKARPKKGVRA